MNPTEIVRQPKHANGGDNAKNATANKQKPTQRVNNHYSSPLAPRSPKLKNFKIASVPTKLISAYNNAISRNSGRPVRKPSRATNKTVAVPMLLTARIRSVNVGPINARTNIIAMTMRIAPVATANIMIDRPSESWSPDPRYDCSSHLPEHYRQTLLQASGPTGHLQ